MLFCPCPKLTPLQSRFLASVAALAILALIYWSFSDAHFAYAAELQVDGSGHSRVGGEDHNWHRIEREQLEVDGIQLEQYAEPATQALRGRATALATTTAGNDQPNNENILPGDTTVWLFPKTQWLSKRDHGEGEVDDGDLDHAELRRRSMEGDESAHTSLNTRQSTEKTIFVSINTCLQPLYNGSAAQLAPPPPLTLYVSTSSDNMSPGPGADTSKQVAIELDEGFANQSTVADGDWYMSVHAPALPSNFSGVWNYELAVSTSDYYHQLGTNGSNLYLIDSDHTAALLVTNNLTQAEPDSRVYKSWLDTPPPYLVFASNANHTATWGLSKSYCGLGKSSQIVGNLNDLSGDSTNVQMEMITRGIGEKPKEQFYITYLNGSTKYLAVLAQPPLSSEGGGLAPGGRVWDQMSFMTKTDGNCALLYDLDFCDQVAYAVPSSPNVVDNYTAFQSFYDDHAKAFYKNFNYSLQQIPCHTDPASQYSNAATCAECAGAYKQWLCAVTIPRCEDFTSNASYNGAPYLQIRNVGQPFLNGTMLPDDFLNTKYVPMSNAPSLPGSLAYQQTYLSAVATNQSRNPKIDAHIAPGPYKEVLPCEDLCYSLVQKCPAALSFACPHAGRGLEVGYGTRAGLSSGVLTCSYLGAYVYADDAFGMGASVFRVLGFAGLAVFLAMMV